jgi:hypothetical protein
MTSTSRAIAALVEIMRDTEQAPRRRIEACEHLLDYECPPRVIEEAKAVLMSIVEDGKTLVEFKLDALKLLRRVEARKVVPGRAVREADIEMRRALEILRRRTALYRAGVLLRPPGYDDDLTGPDYVPHRLGRSLQDLVGFLSELHALRIDLFLHQQGLDTTTPAGKALFQMMGVFAEFERSMIAERVRAGLKRAKAEGKQLGRPRIAPELETRILAALKAGESIRRVAAKFEVNPSTVQRVARPFDASAAA